MAAAGDIVKCEITDISFGGDGVARLPDGAVLFVPLAAIGDKLEVTITQVGKSFHRGEIRKILAPSPDRAAPFCDRYGDCGGCCYQHISYQAELQAKQRQFLSVIRRIGHFEEFPELECTVPAPARQGYRNKLRLEPYFKTGTRELHYGFYERDNKTCFPVKKCPLAQDAVNAAIEKAKRDPQAARNARSRHPAPLTIRTDSQGKSAFYFDYASPNLSWLREQLCEQLVAVPVGSFWQVNPPVAAKLLSTIRGWLQPLGLRSFIDAYGGIGTFSLAMGELFQYRAVIESDKQAIACAKYNHAQRGLKVQLFSRKTENALSDVLAHINKSESCVLLDPPRTGCLPKAIQTLLDFPVNTLVYVSCNAGTLARDLNLLSAKYRPKRAAIFDMFPSTAHFESAVLLASTEK